MKNYTIVNPIIKGSIDTMYMAKEPLGAAISAYKTMSTYFAKNVPEFAFTIQEGGTKYHYIASEKVNDKGKIKFTIKENKNVQNLEKLNTFIENTNSKEGGGSHRRKHSSKSSYRYDDDDSSDSSSDSSSDYNYYRPIKRQSPIDYWYYYPNAYTYKYYYVPQFTQPVSPYVYITLSP
jgi:hypothetical protein